MDLFRKLKLKYPCSDKISEASPELFDHDYVVKHEDATTHNTYMDTFEKSYLKIRSASDINAAYAILALCNSEPFEYTSNGDPLVYDKLFTFPQYAKAGVKYTIAIEYYNTEFEKIWRGVGASNSSAVLCNGNTITFEFSESEGNNNGSNDLFGQIPQLLFSCSPNPCPSNPGQLPVPG